MDIATTIDEQLLKLKTRGMIINNEEKAKEILLDIGYYRLGFYWFPFESKHKEHIFKPGPSFEDVITLYYLDHDLRCILSPYLYRIEVNLRTTLIYKVSNFYKNCPRWFSDEQFIQSNFLEHLPYCYETIIKNEVIRRHHKKYRNDLYAPAWKTLEYMTFGDIISLIKSLKNEDLQIEIAEKYNISNLTVFYNYLDTTRLIRNLCAHGRNIYDLRLQKSIKTGPIKKMQQEMHHNLTGGLLVISYLLKAISANRSEEMKKRLQERLLKPEIEPIKNIINHIKIDIL